MIEPVVKILKPGASEDSVNIADYRFHSRFSMLKYHMDTIQSMTINAGDTEKIISFAHGLDYVPDFVAYLGDSNYIYQLPNRIATISYDRHYLAYADNTNIYIKFKTSVPFNEYRYSADQIYHELDSGSVNLLVGNASGNGYSSAVRFPTIELDRNQSIVSARIDWNNQFSGPTNSDTKMKVFGLDYDNVGDVSTGMDRTSAFISQQQVKLSGTFNFSSNVKSMLEEIIARAGWTSGNRMGFTIENDGSPTDAYVGGTNSSDADLVVVPSGSLTESFRIIIFKDKIA